MIRRRSVSIKLIVAVVALQFCSLVIGVIIAAMFFAQQRTVGDNSTLALIQIAPHIERAEDGSLSISEEGLGESAFRSESFWMFASDGKETVSYGAIPSDVQPILGTATDVVSQIGALDDFDTPAGKLTLFAGGSSPTSSDLLSFSWQYAAELFPIVFIPYLLLAIVLVPSLVRRSMSPIQEAALAAGRLKPELQGQRLPTENAPLEVMPLISAVNAALARMDDWGAQQRRFIANAAHELRTPVTVLQVRLDGLPPSDLTEVLREDCRRIAHLADRLLQMERIRASDIQFETIELNSIARDAVLQFVPLALHYGIDVAFEPVDQPTPVSGNADAIKLCLTNLLENAQRHGGATVVVAVKTSPIVQVRVKDSGMGVSPALAISLFEPFVGTPGRGGAGLGLALVNEIMIAHGGRVYHTTATDGMTEFVMEFPSGRKAAASMAPDN